jgi:hypothetical protein
MSWSLNIAFEHSQQDLQSLWVEKVEGDGDAIEEVEFCHTTLHPRYNFVLTKQTLSGLDFRNVPLYQNTLSICPYKGVISR